MQIPLRTLEEWEAGRRLMPDYVLRLIVYYTSMEQRLKEKGIELEDMENETDIPGVKPDFIFSAKTASLALMNKVLEGIPKPRAEPEHSSDEPHPIDAPDSGQHPEPTTTNNRVKAADLEKRLSLLK